MLITRTEFDERIKNKTLKLCFVGMSNIGKSHSTQLLKADYDFSAFDVDAAIIEKLSLAGMNDIAAWLGYPYEESYQARQTEYLGIEAEQTLPTSAITDKNFILDTTGSVIYLSAEILDQLKKDYLIINFDAGAGMLDLMIEGYFNTPKPVVWGNSFNKQDTETDNEALRRCYPELLSHRVARYRELADITLPGEFTKFEGLTAERFLEILRLSLPE